MIFRRITGAALAAALLAGIAGCGGPVSHPINAEGESIAPSTVSPTPVPSQTAAPATPIAASSPPAPPLTALPSLPSPSTFQQVSDGIENAVKAFYAASNEASATNDPTTYEAVTTPGCPCRAFVDSLKAWKSKGEHWIGGDVTVTRIRVHDLVSGGGSAEVWFKATPAVLVGDDSRPVATATDSLTGHVDMFVVYFNGRWLVANNVDLGK